MTLLLLAVACDPLPADRPSASPDARETPPANDAGVTTDALDAPATDGPAAPSATPINAAIDAGATDDVDALDAATIDGAAP